jgi:hypothetical protein
MTMEEGGLKTPVITGADVDLKLKGSFLLDEAAIRKISSILHERAKSGGKQLIRVGRVDAFSFVTEEIDPVFQQENGDSDKMNRLSFFSLPDAPLTYQLNFETRDGITGRVRGPVRDDVFLLATDLKSYISESVIIKNFITKMIAAVQGLYLLLGLLMLTIGFMSAYTTLLTIPWISSELKSILDNARNSSDLNVKVNAIIDALIKLYGPSRFQSQLLSWNIMFGVIGIGLAICVWFLLKYLYPVNVFLVGKQSLIYKRKEELRSKLF